MQKTTTITLVIIVIILLITGIVIFNKKDANNEPAARDQVQEEMATPEQTLHVKHQYKEGEHVFGGLIETPTPCYDVTAVIVPGNTPELQITTKEQEDVMCAQVITEQSFTVSYRGPENLEFLATLNGELVNLNQFEVDASEDFDSFEIFIKG